MNFLEQVKVLVIKDIMLECRSKAAINSILLYVVSTVFVCYQAFKSVDTLVWNALFWIILLFASITAISRGFTQETQHRYLYYYSLVNPKALVFSKIVYNAILMTIISGTAFVVYGTIFKSPIEDLLLYFTAVMLGAISFSSVFTMVSGISAKTGSNSTIMAILSFPVIIPLLIVLIKLSLHAIQGVERAASTSELFVLIAINVITIAISLLLFPYLWRD
ncbi:heme exporter protein CcmB [Sphingobacterium corticibacter]|uniref:ABC transporter permease n=1 Tax=Sphingobacterium corticibacter TaxID=2171749 RepID=A0A2T8HFC5_9SPHI|nr:heme exporter protein CcmB [Sphingobacterium corticibacter]PVH24126.1 ABC transporter permease [Sphingobacterium corticibacter]